jgi:Domain of unknown function (DUF4340)
MKLQSKTLILLLTALAMAGGVYLAERQLRPSTAQKTESKPLFDLKEDQILGLTVKTPSQTLIFERASQTVPATWIMNSPQPGPANEGVIAFLLNLIATGQSDRTLTISRDKTKEFGLEQPTTAIEVKLKNQQTHRLVLGKSTVDPTKIYALVDPPTPLPPTTSIQIVPQDFATAINRPLSEWQQPPAAKPTLIDPPPSP